MAFDDVPDITCPFIIFLLFVGKDFIDIVFSKYWHFGCVITMAERFRLPFVPFEEITQFSLLLCKVATLEALEKCLSIFIHFPVQLFFLQILFLMQQVVSPKGVIHKTSHCCLLSNKCLGSPFSSFIIDVSKSWSHPFFSVLWLAWYMQFPSTIEFAVMLFFIGDITFRYHNESLHFILCISKICFVEYIYLNWNTQRLRDFNAVYYDGGCDYKITYIKDAQ